MSVSAKSTDSVKSAPERDSVAKGASFTMLASVMAMAIGLVANIILARTLGPDYKGRVDLVNNTIVLAAIVFGLSLTSGITYVVAKGSANLKRLAVILVFIAIAQGLAAWVVITLLSKTKLIGAILPPDYIGWGAVVVSAAGFGAILTGYWRAFLSGLQRFTIAAKLDVISRFLVSLAMIAGIFIAGKNSPETSAVGAIVFSMVAYLVIAIGVPFFMLRHLPVAGASSKIGEIWSFSKPCYFANMIQYANYRLDVFLVAYFIGTRDVALYITAVGLSQLLWLPSNAFASVLLPRLAHMTDSMERAREAAQMTRIVQSVTLLMGLIMSVLAGHLIPLLYGRKFVPSVLPFLLLMPGVISFASVTILASYIAAIGKPRLNLIVSIIACIATVSLNLFLLPRIGMIGAAITSSVSYTMSGLITLYIFQRESNLSAKSALLLTKADMQLIYTWLVKTIKSAGMNRGQ